MLLLVSVTVTPTAGASKATTTSANTAQRGQQASKQASLRARERARERARLRRVLRRSPRRALRGDFLKRAALAGFKMPVTVRLRAKDAGNERTGTQIGITWAATRAPFDGMLFPVPAAEQTLQLDGAFPMIIDFGAGPGYGGAGNLQARTGLGGQITADGPLVAAELAGCAGTPPAFVEAATSTTSGAPIVATPAVQTWVDLNPFSGYSDGYLDLKLSMRSRVLGAAATCATPGPSADYDVPVSTAPSDPWNVPIRLRWSGSFRIAPSITADGAVRMGKITVDSATQPQDATTGNLWGCAADGAVTGAGLPLSTPCTSSGPLVGEPVSPVPLPAALIVKSLSADVLLGDRL